MKADLPLFDRATWRQLPAFFENLPKPIVLNIWGDEANDVNVREAVRLAKTLASEFSSIEYTALPPIADHNYYPVIGIMGDLPDNQVDYGVRIIGLPIGNQMTSLVAAIQSVAFEGRTSEAQTRIQLHHLKADVTLELITSAEDEGGSVMAQMIFNIAVASDYVRAFLIMGDAISDAVIRYSVNYVPHIVINGRVHVEGVVDEQALLSHISAASNAKRAV